MKIKYKCKRCKYQWKPMKENVKQCPFCKSYHWNEPFKRGAMLKQVENIKERKCHFCGKKLKIKGKEAVCEDCKEKYEIIDGKAYRENVYSKMYNKSFKD